MTNKEFIELVWEMRKNQREYFRARGKHELEESKRLERLVDQAISEGIGDDVKSFQTKLL